MNRLDTPIISITSRPDIAELLGVVPPTLPRIVSMRDFAAAPPAPPEQIIDGVLHRGCKMILGGTSKSNKSWCLLDLAISVASGQPWWGRSTTRVPVVYINFELHGWAMAQRLEAICGARPECQDIGDTLHLWNLRGHNTDLALLRPQLEEQLRDGQFGLVIIDPIYKLLGDRDENSNGQVAGLMNELEQLARKSGAAVIVAHHFSKGDSTTKNAMDRMSGAGAWVRDPDSIFVLTPHEEPDCFTVTSILRNQPVLPDFVVRWDFPLLRPAHDLNPDALRTPQSKNKRCTDKEFVDQAVGKNPRSFDRVVRQAFETLEMSRATACRYLRRVTDAGLVRHSGGLYWSDDKTESQSLTSL